MGVRFVTQSRDNGQWTDSKLERSASQTLANGFSFFPVAGHSVFYGLPPFGSADGLQASAAPSGPSFPTASVRSHAALPESQLPEHSTKQNIRSRIRDVHLKSSQTVTNLVSVVGVVSRWLWRRYSETRPIEQIPFRELDQYLIQLFAVLRKPSGLDYDPETFCCFRSNLDRFLKESGYPFSITRAREFARSQKSFQDRRRSLVPKSQQRAKYDVYQNLLGLGNTPNAPDAQWLETNLLWTYACGFLYMTRFIALNLGEQNESSYDSVIQLLVCFVVVFFLSRLIFTQWEAK